MSDKVGPDSSRALMYTRPFVRSGRFIHPSNHSSVHPTSTTTPPCNFNRNLAQVLIEFIR